MQTFDRRDFLASVAGAALACTAIPAAAADDAWGDLVGRFVFDGKAPERKKLKVDKDVDCCGKFDIRDESLLVGPEGGVANIFVYVRSKSLQICPDLENNLPKRVTLDNRGCIFVPHCLTLWFQKQEFYTVNSDPVAQNIAFEPPGDTPCNVILPVGGDATYRFSRKQNSPIVLHCNYHPWESGYILVRDNPYMAVSAQEGTFTIPKLPVGELEFQVWQERAGNLQAPGWAKGRFTRTIKPGVNDLGTIRLAPELFPQT